MADVNNIQEMLKVVAMQNRQKVISEITAFCSEYHHHLDGRDVVIVDQLLEFLNPVPQE
jgi:hypothetical protein